MSRIGLMVKFTFISFCADLPAERERKAEWRLEFWHDRYNAHKQFVTFSAVPWLVDFFRYHFSSPFLFCGVSPDCFCLAVSWQCYLQVLTLGSRSEKTYFCAVHFGPVFLFSLILYVHFCSFILCSLLVHYE